MVESLLQREEGALLDQEIGGKFSALDSNKSRNLLRKTSSGKFSKEHSFRANSLSIEYFFLAL